MLLVFPPVAKPCEPPAGVAQLAAALKVHGIACNVLDANLEGMLYLLGRPVSAADAWTRRAAKHVAPNLASLRDPATYRSLPRYSRAVSDVNRLLGLSGRAYDAIVGLADYQQGSWSPLRSADLLAAAEQPERNPFFPHFSERLPELIERKSSGLIGFSLNYLSQALCTFAMIGLVRRRYPGMRIVLGGGLVTSWARRPGWKDPFGGLVDHLIAGPGEAPLLTLHGVGNAQPDHAQPDYRELPMQEYLAPGFILPYSASSGCYWNKCSFCPEPAEGNPYLPVSASRARADLAELAGRTGPSLIHLLDNAVSPALLRALIADPPGSPWYGFARIDEDLADPDHCVQLRRAGCAMLKLGVESGDQGVLDGLRKGIDVETASRALRSLKQAGIATYVYLLFGTPVESEREAQRTLAFTAAHADAIGFLNLAVFNMPVCGHDAEQYGTGAFYEGDLSLYTSFRHPGGWDRKAVRKFLDNEFKRHPAIAAVLRNDPPFFTSNHAAFFAS
jgi:hypothetical protein